MSRTHQWRGVVEEYRDLLEIPEGTPAVTLREGGTPLVHSEWLSGLTGAEVHLKVEGDNPTGSFKDRGMTAALSVAVHEGAKAVVWAHNSHIGNAAATAMGWQGEFNIGELCRTAFGDEAVLIGFGTDRGTVAAASDWGGDMEIKSIRPARGDSYEHAFRRTGQARSLTDWHTPDRRALANILRTPLLERAIGVVYRPETELLSHYFQAVLAEQFDAFVWFDETHAVTPLGVEHARGAPETWPFGL